MLKKKKKVICYICGKEGANSKDHIPPRGIFPNKTEGQLITVKAHRTCNESFQDDDELFRNLIIAASYRTVEGRTAWEEQVLKSFGKNPGAKEILNKLIIPVRVVDPITGKSFEQEGLRIDVQMVERQISRWTRGLYFNRFKELIDPDSDIEISKLPPPEISITPLMEKFANENLRPKWIHVVKNIFSYSFITSNEAHDIGFIIYVFFNTEVFLATINIKDHTKSKYYKKGKELINKTEFKMPEYNKQNIILFFERLGFCLMQIQTFEFTVERYLTNVHKLDSKMSREEIEKLYLKYGKLTLGNLFREIRQCEKLPEDLEERVNSFISERNWMVHRCRKGNESDLYNDEKFALLYNRLTFLSDEALSLSQYFQEKSEKYIIDKGLLTKEQLDKYTQDYLDSLKEV